MDPPSRLTKKQDTTPVKFAADEEESLESGRISELEHENTKLVEEFSVSVKKAYGLLEEAIKDLDQETSQTTPNQESIDLIVLFVYYRFSNKVLVADILAVLGEIAASDLKGNRYGQRSPVP